jgi:nucleoside-diphosphate-sugar epimerase
VSNILVTGADGFIGRVLVRQLLASGHAVTELDLVQGDISMSGALRKYEEETLDHVFHLAGRTFVPESWKDPCGFYQVNVMGTVNVAELCRKTGARLTYVSSYLYGEPEYLPIDENHPVKSYNPYSHSKIVAESVCQFYAKNFNLEVSVFRPFNAYGPGQPPAFLIPEIVSKVMNREVRIVEVMDLRPRRDFIFVEDLSSALVRSIAGPQGIFNIGSGYSKSVEEIILQVMKSAGISKDYRSLEVSRPNEILDLYADISKAKAELDWSPKISFEVGIEKCISAYSPKTERCDA